MRLEDFAYHFTITARFADGDIMGHVNNAKYVTYLEEARINYAREVLGWRGGSNALGMILARTEIDYRLPLHIGDTVNVYVRCSRIGGKSFDLSYAIVMNESNQPVATAVTTMVAFDYGQGISVPVVDDWRSRIHTFEKTPPDGV